MRDVWFRGDGGVVGLHRRDLVVGLQTQPPLLGVQDVGRDRAVGDVALGVDVQDGLLVHALEHVAAEQHHDLVGHEQHPLTAGVDPDLVQHGPQPLCDIGPGLPARRAVVELAEQGPPLGLLGELRGDAAARQPVEHPELPLPQALVDDGRQVQTCLLQGDLGRRARR